MTEPLEINMKIVLNEEAFEGISDQTRDVFMMLMNSELEKMAHRLSMRASCWMFNLKHPNFGKENEVD